MNGTRSNTSALPGRAARPNLVLHAGDATTLAFDEVLAPGPVCVIAEGLLVYLDAPAQQALWRRVAALCAAIARPRALLLNSRCLWAIIGGRSTST